MTRIGSTEAAILTWLADHEQGTASEIGHACGVEITSVRGRLVFLQKQRLVTMKPNDAVPPGRVYAITVEGRRKVAEVT